LRYFCVRCRARALFNGAPAAAPLKKHASRPKGQFDRDTHRENCGFATPAALAAASVDAIAAILRSEQAYETPSVATGSSGAEQQLALNLLTLEQRCRVQAAGLIFAAKLAVADSTASRLQKHKHDIAVTNPL
jgi:hypothetical protein